MPLVTQDGETVRFYDDLIDGKIVVVNFVYTDCPDICGLTTARLAQVHDWLGDRVGRDIFLYSISLDPANDTPEKMKAYAEAFGAGEGWLFLTGEPDNIDLVRHKLGERSRKLSEHRTDMVIGNDATGEWRRASLMGSLVIATQEILALDPNWEAPEVAALTPAPASPELGGPADHPGEALFLRGCAACHTIGEGVRIGPDLAGVTAAPRPRLAAALPDGARRACSPRAIRSPLALDAKFPAVGMPNLGLGRLDAEDVIRYLRSGGRHEDVAASDDRGGVVPIDPPSHSHDHGGSGGHSH